MGVPGRCQLLTSRRQHAAVKQSCPPHFEAEQQNSSGCFAAPPFPIEGM